MRRLRHLSLVLTLTLVTLSSLLGNGQAIGATPGSGTATSSAAPAIPTVIMPPPLLTPQPTQPVVTVNPLTPPAIPTLILPPTLLTPQPTQPAVTVNPLTPPAIPTLITAPTVPFPPTATPVPTSTAVATPAPTSTAVSTPSATALPTNPPPSTPTATASATASPTATMAVATVAPSACTASSTATGLLAPANAKNEIVGLRTQNSRTFDTHKGNYQRVVGTGSLNYKDAQGQWQPIDTTIVQAKSGAALSAGAAIEPAASGYTLALPPSLATPVRFRVGNDSVSFAPQGGTGTLSTCGSSATYANALPGVNLTYTALSDGFKEAITLASSASPSTYTFAVDTSAGLMARKAARERVEFVNGSGAVVFAFAAPFMYDSAAPRPAHSTRVTVDLAPATNGYTLTVNADKAWLTEKARVYPVTIDPSGGPPYSNPTKDCYIESANATTNQCGSGYSLTAVGFGTQYGTDHALLQFDVSSLASNASIRDAYVNLYLDHEYQNSGSCPPAPNNLLCYVGARQVTSDWDPSAVTWNNRDANDAWGKPGGDFQGQTPPDQNWVAAGHGTYSFDVADMTQTWINNSSTNHGVLFETDGTAEDPLFFFASSGYSDSTKRPVLVITYQPTGGPGAQGADLGKRPFYTLANSQLDDRSSLSVNLVTGNLIVQATDLTLMGTGLPLRIDRYYNSKSVFKGVFGNNWSLGLGADVFLINEPDGTEVLQGNSGYQIAFSKNQDGSYQTPPGEDATLVKQPDGSFWLKMHADGSHQEFDSSGRYTWLVDKNNNRIQFIYDNNGRMTDIHDTQNRTVHFDYNGSGYISQMTDTLSNRVAHYDYNGDYLTRYTDFNGKVTQYSYNGSNYLSAIQDPRGTTNAATFDYGTQSPPRIIAVYRVGLKSSIDYPSLNNDGSGTAKLTDPNPGNPTTEVDWDTNGLISKSVDANGHAYTYEHNSDYKETKIHNANGQTVTYGYDGDNERLTDVTLPTGANTHTTYDGCPAVDCYYPKTVRDPQGNTTTYRYDGNGNQIETDRADGNNTQTQYNGDGTIAQTTDARRSPPTYYHYQYSGGQLTQMTVSPPAPLGGTQTNYSFGGHVTSVVDGKGQTTNPTFDAMDRVKTLTFNDGASISYNYDENGNQTQRVDNTGTTNYSYDLLNRQTQKAVVGGVTIQYGYDNVGNLTSVNDGTTLTTYGYDNANNLTDVWEGTTSGPHTSLSYDNDNNIKTTSYPNGVTLTRGYDGSDRLTRITSTAGGVALTDYSYAYSHNGGDTSLRQSGTAADNVFALTTTYTYDALNRLTEAASVQTGTSMSGADYQYGYDPNGNRTSYQVGGGIGLATSSFNDANEETSKSNGGTTFSFSYDPNGNETGNGVDEGASYNAKNQTTALNARGGTLGSSITYAGTGQGERLTAGSSSYVNTSVGITREQTANGTVTYTNTPTGKLVAQHIGGATYYYLFDGQGSVVGLTDSGGNLVARYLYDPYGQTVEKSGAAADGNPFRYIGGYLDATGLYKLGERYYDPSRGRFLQIDPLGTGYIYAGDNPVNFIDPSGFFPGFAEGLGQGGLGMGPSNPGGQPPEGPWVPGDTTTNSRGQTMTFVCYRCERGQFDPPGMGSWYEIWQVAGSPYPSQGQDTGLPCEYDVPMWDPSRQLSAPFTSGMIYPGAGMIPGPGIMTYPGWGAGWLGGISTFAGP